MVKLEESRSREVEFLTTKDGRCLVLDWLRSLKDNVAKARVLVRIKRASLGNLGDYKYLREGVYEMRIPYGPGLRLYFSITKENELLLLLIGGDKSTQGRDIVKAIGLYQEYKEQDHE